MKSAKVDAKGLTTWLWLSTYGKSIWQLPKNFCDFFWESVLSYIIAIFAWPGHLFNLLKKDTSFTKAWGWIFHIPVAFIFYFIVFEGKSGHSVPISYLYGVLFTVCAIVLVAVCALIVAGVIELKDWIVEKIHERRYEKRRELREKGIDPDAREKEPMGIVTWWKSFKGKYCPKIEWQNLEPQEPEDTGFGFRGTPIGDDDYDEAYNHN